MRPCISLLALLVLSIPASAAPRDELLRLVPEDVGFCVVVQDLRGHNAAIAASPFAEQFNNSFLGRAIRSAPEFTRLVEMEKQLKQQLGVDWPQLRDDILGDAFVMAYRPGPPGKMEEEEGLLLLRARNTQLLATLVERLNAAQKKSGDLLKLEECTHQGVKYYRRVEKNHAPYYYWLSGAVLAVSPQEPMLQRVLALDRRVAAADSELPPLVKHLRQLKADKALLAVWLNPRAFEADLEKKAREAPAAEAAFLKPFLGNWKALESIAFTANPQENLELALAIRAKPDGLSPGVRKFFAEAGRPSELWKAFPEDALLAAAGRIDGLAVAEMIGDFLPEDSRKALRDAIQQGNLPAPFGKLAKEVLPNLGPDAGFYVTAPKADDKNWFPQVVWAVRVRPGAADTPADQTLLDILNFLANLAVLDHNAKNPDRLTLKSTTQDKLEIKYFVNDKRFPPGFQPAYTVKDGFLLLTSTPELIRSFKLGSAQAVSEETPLLRTSLVALRNYLKERRDPLIEHLADKHQISKEEAMRRLESLRMGIQFVDRVDLVQRTEPNQVTFTIRIKPSQPLRK